MDVEALRRVVDEIDAEILRLVAKRLGVVREIGKIKAAKGKPVTDEERESAVLRRWEALAHEVGISSDVATGIAELLIKYSKALQLGESSSAPLSSFNTKMFEPVVFVGYGGMARVLARAMLSKGIDVVITGRSPQKAEELARELGCGYAPLNKLSASGKMVILALSPRAFEEGFVDIIAPSLKGRVVSDILSVKTGFFEHLERLSKIHGFHYLSLHPLFSPYTPYHGEKVVVIPSETGAEHLDLLIRFWATIGLEPIVIDYRDHDRIMAVVQVTSHLLLTAFLSVVDKLSRKLEVEPKKLETPTFRRFMALALNLSKIRDVVAEIQKYNPYTSLVHDAVLNVLQELRREWGVP